MTSDEIKKEITERIKIYSIVTYADNCKPFYDAYMKTVYIENILEQNKIPYVRYIPMFYF